MAVRDAAVADAAGVRSERPRREGAHPRGRRVPDRSLAAGGATHRASALALYRALRRVNPSPYHFLLELGGLALVGSSPETLVKLEGTRASVNPIAGTVAPGTATQLLASEKDGAEHVCSSTSAATTSRVCRQGTVRVGRFLVAERYSHVSHSSRRWPVSCSGGVTSFDLLRATFPAAARSPERRRYGRCS